MRLLALLAPPISTSGTPLIMGVYTIPGSDRAVKVNDMMTIAKEMHVRTNTAVCRGIATPMMKNIVGTVIRAYVIIAIGQ
jgi:hypothetical protein